MSACADEACKQIAIYGDCGAGGGGAASSAAAPPPPPSDAVKKRAAAAAAAVPCPTPGLSQQEQQAVGGTGKTLQQEQGMVGEGSGRHAAQEAPCPEPADGMAEASRLCFQFDCPPPLPPTPPQAASSHRPHCGPDSQERPYMAFPTEAPATTQEPTPTALAAPLTSVVAPTDIPAPEAMLPTPTPVEELQAGTPHHKPLPGQRPLSY